VAFNPPLNTNTGVLVLRGAGSIAAAATNGITLNNGGTLVLDNTAQSANRLNDAAPIVLSGGTLSLIGNAAGTNESIGNVTVNPGASFESTIRITSTGGTLTSLTGTDLMRNAGASLNLVGVGGDLGGAANQLVFTGNVPLSTGSNPILPFAPSPARPDSIWCRTSIPARA